VTPGTLRVVRGSATAEEMAALVAVVTTVARAAVTTGVADGGPRADGDPAGTGASVWSARARSLRGGVAADLLRPGPSAWRTSAWPR
jgi:hypothetical protein